MYTYFYARRERVCKLNQCQYSDIPVLYCTVLTVLYLPRPVELRTSVLSCSPETVCRSFLHRPHRSEERQDGERMDEEVGAEQKGFVDSEPSRGSGQEGGGQYTCVICDWSGARHSGLTAMVQGLKQCTSLTSPSQRSLLLSPGPLPSDGLAPPQALLTSPISSESSHRCTRGAWKDSGLLTKCLHTSTHPSCTSSLTN